VGVSGPALAASGNDSTCTSGGGLVHVAARGAVGVVGRLAAVDDRRIFVRRATSPTRVITTPTPTSTPMPLLVVRCLRLAPWTRTVGCDLRVDASTSAECGGGVIEMDGIESGGGFEE
jgi:hypothetical protein